VTTSTGHIFCYGTSTTDCSNCQNHGGRCKLQADTIGAKQINVCEDIHKTLTELSMHELPQLHNWTAWLGTWNHYNPLKCWKLTPNRMAPISKRNETCSNNTVRTSNLILHWKETKTLDSITYSQVSSRVRWLSGEQTNTSRTIFVLAIKELSRTHQFMWSKFLQLITHQLYKEKHKVTWHSIIHFFVPATGKNQITMALSISYITNTAS